MKKSGLSIDRSVALLTQFTQRVDGIVNSIVRDHATQTDLIGRMTLEVYSNADYKRMPFWAQSKVTGYYHGKSDMVMRFLTVFAYKYEGTLYRTTLDKHSPWPSWEESTPGGLICQQCEESGYYWPDGKVYFISPKGL